jgi:acyl-CoA hydrolase
MIELQIGDVVTVKAKVNRTFKTSMEVGVIVEAEDMIISLLKFNSMLSFTDGTLEKLSLFVAATSSLLQ